jgi:hypothetical protein
MSKALTRSTGVEQSPQHPEVKGLSPATAAGTGSQPYKPFYGHNLRIFVVG